MSRGSLRVYLGAAPGVGKTFAMLSEGRRRAVRGTDVVIGWVETHGRSATAEQIGDLEVVPPVTVRDEDGPRREMDVPAVLARHPQVVLVDELAHANSAGSRNPRRLQDVTELLDAGIDVVSTLNLHHLESIYDVVEHITGMPQPETIPDDVVRGAQVELVDATPEALRRRMAHGNIYRPEAIDAAVTNYFQPERLAALRELALLWMADQVETTANAHRRRHHEVWETRERVVVGITGAADADRILRRAARIARRAHGDLVGVYVRGESQVEGLEDDALSKQRALLTELGGRYHETTGADVASALVDFARGESATQIVVGAAVRSRRPSLWKGAVVNRVLQLAGPIDVHVISQRAPSPASPRSPVPEGAAVARRSRRRRLARAADLLVSAVPGRSLLHPRRQALGWLFVLAGLPALTALLSQLRGSVALNSDLLFYLLFVVVAAALGGLAPALTAAVAGTLVVNWFFTRPIHTWAVARRADVLALVVYLGTAGIVSTLVSIAAHRSSEARRANAEAETLAMVASDVVDADPLPVLMVHLREALGLAGVSLLRLEEGSWAVEAAVGEAPLGADDADETHELREGLLLALSGKALATGDRRVVNAFVANLAAALDRRHLHAQAAEAGALAAASELRRSLLQAVSHDLRTPLASIKASVSSLRQRDIAWSPAESTEFLATIEDETDRLTHLVGNLLDMSRVNAKALAPSLRPTALDAVVASALASLGPKAKAVDVDVPDDLPGVYADPALLERVVANLVDNGLTHAPDSPLRVDAGSVGDRVLLRVIDRGPGIARAERERVFQSFQRLGDGPGANGAGVGLGLAVARGFTEAVGADLSIEDTPGGGLTMVVEIEACR